VMVRESENVDEVVRESEKVGDRCSNHFPPLLARDCGSCGPMVYMQIHTGLEMDRNAVPVRQMRRHHCSFSSRFFNILYIVL